jgi:hypothetical protein
MPKRDWSAHDAATPYRDDRLRRLNGTSPTGRRPHALAEPERLRLPRADNDNDNTEPKDAAA